MRAVVVELLREVCSFFFFFFNDTATTEIYTLSLHDALPIRLAIAWSPSVESANPRRLAEVLCRPLERAGRPLDRQRRPGTRCRRARSLRDAGPLAPVADRPARYRHMSRAPTRRVPQLLTESILSV